MSTVIAQCGTPGQGNIPRGGFAKTAELAQIHTMQLANIRKARKLSLIELGEMIGMAASTVHRAEKMDPTAKLATYQLCATALGVTLEEIFNESRTEQELALLKAFRKIPEDQHELLLGLFERAANPPPSVE